MLRTTLSLLSLLTLLPAQEPFQAKQFFFDDYSSIVTVDLKRVRDLGIWDELDASLLKLAIAQMEQQMGFPATHLDRVTSVSRWDEQNVRLDEITAMEGNAELTRSTEDQSWQWTEAKLGNFDVLRSKWDEQQLQLNVSKTLRVSGPEQFLRPVLEGKPRSGLPSADVMSLTVGVKHLLGYAVLDMRNGNQRDDLDKHLLPDVKWPADDQPTFVCVRFRATGDEDDPHIVLDVLVRHQKSGGGVAVTKQAVEDELKALRKKPELRMFYPLLKKVESKADGLDVTWSVDLGASRAAIGLLAAAIVPFAVVAGDSVQQAVQLEVAEEIVEEPAPLKKPAGGGKR